MSPPIFYLDPQIIENALKSYSEWWKGIVSSINKAMENIAIYLQLEPANNLFLSHYEFKETPILGEWRIRDNIKEIKHRNPYFTSYIPAYALQKAIRRGNVKKAARQGKLFIDSTSYTSVLNELKKFPIEGVIHDDSVDALSIGVDHLDHRCRCTDLMKPLKNQFHPKQNELRRK